LNNSSPSSLQGSQQRAPQPLREGGTGAVGGPDDGAQLRIAVAQQGAVVDIGRTHLRNRGTTGNIWKWKQEMVGKDVN